MKTHLHRRLTPSPTYTTWLAIKKRCNNPKAAGFDKYGAAGIKVCPEWVQSFEAFLAHAGERPSKAHTLDRIDGKKGYEPGNVRWATMMEQNRNRSDNLRLTFNGKTQVAKDWAYEMNLNPPALYARLRKGWPLERALTEPQRPRAPRQKRAEA